MPGDEHVHHGQPYVSCWDKLEVFRSQPNQAGPTFRRVQGTFHRTLVLAASGT